MYFCQSWVQSFDNLSDRFWILTKKAPPTRIGLIQLDKIPTGVFFTWMHRICRCVRSTRVLLLLLLRLLLSLPEGITWGDHRRWLLESHAHPMGKGSASEVVGLSHPLLLLLLQVLLARPVLIVLGEVECSASFGSGCVLGQVMMQLRKLKIVNCSNLTFIDLKSNVLDTIKIIHNY